MGIAFCAAFCAELDASPKVSKRVGTIKESPFDVVASGEPVTHVDVSITDPQSVTDVYVAAGDESYYDGYYYNDYYYQERLDKDGRIYHNGAYYDVLDRYHQSNIATTTTLQSGNQEASKESNARLLNILHQPELNKSIRTNVDNSPVAIRTPGTTSKFSGKNSAAKLVQNGDLRYNTPTNNVEDVFIDLDNLGAQEKSMKSYKVWARPFYDNARTKTTNGNKYWDAGSLFGFNYKNQKHFYGLGLVLGFDFGKIELTNDNRNNAKFNSFIIGGQASYGAWANGSIDLLYLRKYRHIKQNRFDIGTSQIANAKYRNVSDMFNLEFSHYWMRCQKKWVASLSLGHTWMFDKTSGYKEFGVPANIAQTVAQVKGHEYDVYGTASLQWNESPKNCSGEGKNWLNQLTGTYTLRDAYVVKNSSSLVSIAANSYNTPIAGQKGWSHFFEARWAIRNKENLSFGLSASMTLKKKYVGYGFQLGAAYKF